MGGVEEAKECEYSKWQDTSLLKNHFEIVDGKRRGSKIYRKDDFGYLMSKEENSNTFYLTCVKRNIRDSSSGCPSRAILFNNKLSITKEHNHAPSKMYFQINALEQRMKRRAEEGKESMRKIFDEECLMDSETATHISFKSIRGSMEKRRRRDGTANTTAKHCRS